ncbi:hypothetical protein BN194_02200 [Lacticaseibacillus paracasei]|nr:hypothetical protein BN194_02200 [Lacticaseibacillus paracasei]
MLSSLARVINGSAPLITPVSYPNSMPPKVAITEIMRSRLRADLGSFSESIAASFCAASATSALFATASNSLRIS